MNSMNSGVMDTDVENRRFAKIEGVRPSIFETDLDGELRINLQDSSSSPDNKGNTLNTISEESAGNYSTTFGSSG